MRPAIWRYKRSNSERPPARIWLRIPGHVGLASRSSQLRIERYTNFPRGRKRVTTAGIGEVRTISKPRMRLSPKFPAPGFAGPRRLPRLCSLREPPRSLGLQYRPRTHRSTEEPSPPKNCHRKFRLLTSTVSRCRSEMCRACACPWADVHGDQARRPHR